jgi:tripartite-type tricarboxylate transporter receptor subunit TctC
LAACAAGIACAQDYPNRPIRILTAQPGGSPNLISRAIAPGMSSALGQQVVVDNRGLIAIETAAKAPPDGYTLLIYGSSIWLMPYLRDNVPYDPLLDFAPVSLSVSAPNVMVVTPTMPVKTVKDLIAVAKARPGEINYGTSSPGATSSLAMELFKSMAKVDIVRINYKGTGPALTAAISGEVQLMIPTAGGVFPHVKSGRLRALAITSAQPTAIFPDLPTIAASAGLPGYESIAVYAVMAPGKTPAAIVNRLHQEVVKALNDADVKQRLLSVGIEVIGGTPEAMTAFMKSEMVRMGKVIKDAGLRGN